MLPSRTAIQPVLIGDNAEVLAVAGALAAAGSGCGPSVPPGPPHARLRVSLTAAHDEVEVIRLARTLMELEGSGVTA